MVKTLSPIEAFLAPLAKITLKHPDLEGEVIWADGGEWLAQDDTEGLLDAEEVPFYAEGLLLEGFQMHYQILAETDAPKDPAHVRLFFWQTGSPTPPAPEDGLTQISAASWPAISVTSNGAATTRPPSAATRATAACNSASSTGPLIATANPSRASASAAASPIPRDDPVTNATLLTPALPFSTTPAR